MKLHSRRIVTTIANSTCLNYYSNYGAPCAPTDLRNYCTSIQVPIKRIDSRRLPLPLDVQHLCQQNANIDNVITARFRCIVNYQRFGRFGRYVPPFLPSSRESRLPSIIGYGSLTVNGQKDLEDVQQDVSEQLNVGSLDRTQGCYASICLLMEDEKERDINKRRVYIDIY